MKAWLRTHGRFMLLAVLCVGFSVFAAVFFIRSLLLPDVGLLGSYPEAIVDNGSLVFSPSKPFSAAATAGLVPDEDTLIAVNGRDVHTSRDLVSAIASIHGFAPFPVELEHSNGVKEVIQVTPSFRPTRLDWVCLLIFSVALALMAWVVTWRMPQEDYSPPIVLSALLSLVFTYLMPFAYESALSNALYNVGNIASWLLVIFALYFPERRGPRVARIVVIAAIICVYATFCIVRVETFTRWMATGEEGVFTLYKSIGQAGNISDGVAYVVLAILLGSAYRRTRSPSDRAMLGWMIAGLLIALPPYFFLDQFPEVMGGAAHGVGLGALSQLFLSVLPIFFLIALTRHGSFDLRAFLARYAMWATLIVLATGFFFVAYLPISSFVRGSYRLETPVPELFSAGAIMAVLAALRWPLERMFSSLVKPRDEADTGPTKTVGRQLLAAGAVPGSSRLGEARALLAGVVRELKDPVRALRETTVARGDRVQQEAVDRVAGFLHALQDHVGPSVGIAGAATPREIVLLALDRVRSRFPRIDFDLSGDDGMKMPCVPGELVEVVAELLRNAAEAAPPGSSRVCTRLAADRDASIIEISDEGHGIEARVRRRLFQPFVTTKPGHTGLGLYFARIVMERNAGDIEMTAREGHGTVARLAFRRLHREAANVSEES